MGGGGGDTVVDGGLSDDQFQDLADNQVGISGQISDARTDATTRYDSFDSRFDGLDTSVSGVGDNLTSGFTNISDLMDTYNQGMNKQFDAVNTGVGANNTAIGGNATALNNLSTDVSGGFDTMGGRFDNVDAANSNVQTAVDQGFVDQAQGFSDAQADRTAQFSATNDGVTAGFDAAGEALEKGFGDTSTQLTDTQANVLEGQGNLGTTLDTMQGTADAYATTQLDNQAAMQSNQEGFVTNFDSYVDRYKDDTTLANKSRADMATAQANQTDKLREDIGTYAQAAATGQANLSGQLGDVATATGNDLAALGTTVEGGFSANSLAADQQAENLTTRLGNVKNLLQTTGDNIDASTKAQYENLSSSFDDSGNLIKNSIDDQGNTITRSMDDQGVMIETKFDAAGNQVGQVSTDVNQMLTNAEAYQAETASSLANNATAISSGFQNTAAGTDGIMSSIGSVGDGINSNIGDIGNQLQAGNEGLMAGIQNAETNLGNTMQTNQDASSTQFDNALTGLQTKLEGGFQNMDAASISQAQDLAGIAATQGDLDIGMRQNFKQLSTAFGKNGELIRNSIDEQGNTISRAVDANGNLLLKSFDVTGKEIGNKVININRSLSDLGGLKNVAGANTSMGNLSPAMQGNVPTSGFMSPFSQTR